MLMCCPFMLIFMVVLYVFPWFDFVYIYIYVCVFACLLSPTFSPFPYGGLLVALLLFPFFLLQLYSRDSLVALVALPLPLVVGLLVALIVPYCSCHVLIVQPMMCHYI